MIRHVAATALSLMILFNGSPAHADPPSESCVDSVSLGTAGATCGLSAEETADLYASGDGHHYAIVPTCAVGGAVTCASQETCFGTSPGFVYTVLRDGVEIGTVCLSDEAADQLGEVTPAKVLSAFRRLTWPTSELTVQPPDGVTLVGFDSNFFTTNTAPTTQTVTLLGRRITIEATPTSYVWHFDDASSETTTTPGAAYPDLLVTHRYLHTGEMHPSVDTVYAGRYRIGTGQWQDIPGTLTVVGQTQQLDVREARGVLVGR